MKSYKKTTDYWQETWKKTGKDRQILVKTEGAWHEKDFFKFKTELHTMTSGLLTRGEAS